MIALGSGNARNRLVHHAHLPKAPIAAVPARNSAPTCPARTSACRILHVMKLGRKSESEVRKKLVQLAVTVLCILLCSAGAFYEVEGTWGKDAANPEKRLLFHKALYWCVAEKPFVSCRGRRPVRFRLHSLAGHALGRRHSEQSPAYAHGLAAHCPFSSWHSLVAQSGRAIRVNL
jgi:hypothetical protein